MSGNALEVIDLKRALLASTFLSIEQKLDLAERGFSMKGDHLFIHTEEVIHSPQEEISLEPPEPLNLFSEDPIEISEDVRRIGINYANRKISQRKWSQAHYRAEKNIRDPNKKMTESTAFKKTTMRKLGLMDEGMSPKVMHEKSRRNNQRMQEDGIARVILRRKGDLEPKEGSRRRLKKTPGRYTSNKCEMTEVGFQALKLLEDHQLMYSRPKEILFFLTTGTKMDHQKRRKKHTKGGVPEHERRSTTEGISKELGKGIVREDKSSSASFSFERVKKSFSKKEIDLGKEFERRLLKELKRTEHRATLKLQARTLLRFNNGDVEATRAHHERILSEHKRQQKKGIIKNEGAWRQSAINRGIELNGTMQPAKKKEAQHINQRKEKNKTTEKPKPSTENPPKNPSKTSTTQKEPPAASQEKSHSSSQTDKAHIKDIQQAIHILPRRDEISDCMAKRWLSAYKSPENIKNAIWAAYERNQKDSGIKNLEAYITSLIKKEAKPQKFKPQEHEMIEKNKRILQEKVPKLRAKGIGITTIKTIREGRDFYEIKLSRQKACGGFDVLEIAFFDPKLGALITDFEKRHEEEKKNVPKNQEWVEESVKSIRKKNKNLNVKTIHSGYRLYVKTEQVIGDQKRQFMDHIELKLSSPQTLLKNDLNDFLMRNNLFGRQGAEECC